MPHRPIPISSAESRPFWEAAAQRRLALPQCPACDLLFYPPPPRCPHCLGDALSWRTLSGRARVVSWTTAYIATVPGIEPPFTIVEAEVVEQDGLVVVAHAAPNLQDRLTAGMLVDLAFTEPADGVAYPEFRLPVL